MPHTLERLAPASTRWVPLCVLCSRPVRLETCNTDERGKFVHEQCYFRKIKLKQSFEHVWHSHLRDTRVDPPRGPNGVKF